MLKSQAFNNNRQSNTTQMQNQIEIFLDKWIHQAQKNSKIEFQTQPEGKKADTLRQQHEIHNSQ